MTAEGREQRLKARPSARFNSLRKEGTDNQQQEPPGNTLLAQRSPLSGNSYFWRTARHRRREASYQLLDFLILGEEDFWRGR